MYETDHKARALTLLNRSREAHSNGELNYAQSYREEALVHSNLAIAEGQERVAEELRRVHTAIDGIAYGMGANAVAAEENRA